MIYKGHQIDENQELAPGVCVSELIEDFVGRATLRERAALEQASRARQSVVELTARLEEGGARIDESNRAWRKELHRAEAIIARADELQSILDRLPTDGMGVAGEILRQAKAAEKQFRDRVTEMEQERNAAQAQVERLREALKFYANNDDVIFRTDDGGKVAIAALSAERQPDTARSEQGHLASCSYWTDGPDSCNCVSQIREVRCNDCDSVLTPKRFEDIVYVDPCPHCARAEEVRALEAAHEAALETIMYQKQNRTIGCKCAACKWLDEVAAVEAARKGGEQ